MTTRLCKFAHALNNSLTVINGHAELLKNDFPTEERIARHVAAVQEAVRRAAEIIDACQCAVAYGEYIARARAENGMDSESSFSERAAADD